MSNTLGLTLEFRDSEPHFHGPIGNDHYNGHEWLYEPWGSNCSHDGCEVEALWQRISVAHPNNSDVQPLCKLHGAKIWNAIVAGNKAAVLVARDWDDEFAPVVYELEAPTAKFPGADYYA